MATDAADEPPDETAIVQAAVAAAEDVIFSAYPRSAIRDLDVSVTLEDARLEVDVYLDVPDEPEAERVADDAALAARAAVDERLES